MDEIEFTSHLGCTVRLVDFGTSTPMGGHLGPGMMLSLSMQQPGDGRYAEVHLAPADLDALFRQAKADAWDEGYSHLFDHGREGNEMVVSLDDNPYRET